MISPETRAEIRRYFYAEHWKIATIARELNVHPDAVRKRHRERAVQKYAALRQSRGKTAEDQAGRRMVRYRQPKR